MATREDGPHGSHVTGPRWSRAGRGRSHDPRGVPSDLRRLWWFDLRAGRELEAGSDGIVRLAAAPGLWIDTAALFTNDYPRLMAVLEHRLATPEHAEFVRRLSAR